MTDDKMTDYDEIIRYIQSMQVIEKLSSKYLHYLKSDRDDFIQEMYVIILTIPRDKITALFERNELVRYIIQIVKNQLFNHKSNFSKKFERNIKKIPLQVNNDKD